MENLTWNLISMRFTKKLFFLTFLTLTGTVFFEPTISLAGPITDTYNAGTSVNELQQQAGKPTNRIKIPGIAYSDIKQVEEAGDTYLYIPYIGEYLSIVYRYLVVIAGLIAVIVIIIAGIQWTASGGNSSSIESAKNKIVGALTGLGLAVGSYIILYTVNPELVNFRSLKIKYIVTEELVDYDKNPDDYEGEGSIVIPGNEAIASAALNEAKGQGCGKNLPAIAAAFAGQVICQGPNHCANFASRVLALSGCDKSYQSNSATALRNKLKANGWQIIDDTAGVQPGDIVFWGKQKSAGDSGHVEVAISSSGKTIGSNIDMTACWQGKTREIEKKCGNFWTVFKNGEPKEVAKFPYLKDVPSRAWTYSECVATFHVCPPWGKGFESECGYCAKLGPADEFYNPKGEGNFRQCVQEGNGGKWTHYARNPNK